MAREKAVTVQIFNQTYRLSTTNDRDSEYVKRAAAYLDGKMREAASQLGASAPLDVAILAALNIAEEVLLAHQQKESLLDEADSRISSFTRRLAHERQPSGSEGSRF
jgi:cell division protein ZapA (FtsZ GTPase activity inhibitor)